MSLGFSLVCIILSRIGLLSPNFLSKRFKVVAEGEPICCKNAMLTFPRVEIFVMIPLMSEEGMKRYFTTPFETSA